MKKRRFGSKNRVAQNIQRYFCKSILASMLMGASVLFSCTSDIKQINFPVDLSTLPMQSAKNIEILYSDSAVLKIKIVAPVLERYTNKEDPYIEFKDGINVFFYDEDKNIESSLKANYATFDEKTETWEAKEDVVVVNKKGEIINTELLIWDRKNKLLTSDKFVKITTAEEILYGEGFEADQNFNNYTIHNPKGEINLKK
ncbi:MAG: LPS export ABC transporter periplasmic protein LptC [Bacteroidales bacterium]|nr:LPS export ABC transporter periplasmic protein LptC [Bacteroidales bacterium]MCF8454594.1 LPS export ABC transporter periplasmic protein LptC [Bacteroidales bacterium]